MCKIPVMRKYLIIAILFILGNSLFSQESKPFLVINPDGHKGQVRSLIVTSDKKQIITGGFDKTIKVWDIESGEMVREILGEIGTGSNGMIYSMALSPDDRYLATGGWFGSDGESEPIGDIRIYDFKTGKLLFLLKGINNVVHALTFTPDGKGLLAGSGESDLILWDLETRSIKMRYNQADPNLKLGWQDDVLDIAVHGDRFISADMYGRIKLWQLDKKDTLRCDHYYEQIPAEGVGWSPDGKYMMAVADTFLTMYNADFKAIAEATWNMKFIFASFSPDSKKVLLGSSGRGNERTISVIEVDSTGWTNYADFTDFDNSVLAGAFIDNETYAIAGGDRDEVMIVRLKGKNEKPELLKRISPKGNIIYAASVADLKIAYSDEWTGNFGFSEYNKQFDMVNKTTSKPEKGPAWPRPVTQQNGFKLERYRIGDALDGGLYIIKGKEEVDSIPLERWNGDEHRSFTFAGHYIISGASYGTLRAYNYNGVEVSRFVGHVGDIEGVSITADGKWLVSASNDRTIKIWPLDKMGEGKPVSNQGSVADWCKEMKKYSLYKSVFKEIGVDDVSLQPTKEAWLKVIEELVKNDYKCYSYKLYFTEIFSNDIYPLVSIFVDENNEWIIWDEQGYFTSSKRGSRYVGYHVNQGKAIESKYFPFEQFDLKYNRPDIIMKELSMANEEVIKAYYMAYQKRLKRMGMEESQLSGDIHLPVLSLENYNYDAVKQNVHVNIKATDDKYELDRLNVYVNDVPVYGTQGISLKTKNLKDYSTALDIQLCPGKNKVQVSVLNSKGAESLKETFNVINNATDKPDLYLVSIGVSKYKDPKFNLNFAAKDAGDVAKFFATCSLYNKVYVKEITNEQATREAILDLKKTFLAQAQTKDVVMVFVAGHGVLDNDMNYYFGTYNMDFMNPASGGIAYEELEQLLDGIKPIRKLFFMDSCHSGELDKDEYSLADNIKTEVTEVTFRDGGTVGAVAKNGFGLSQSAQLASDLFADLRRGTGATIISSAGGAEFAMEGEAWKNGLFTYCFLSGIKENAADKNKDGMILISEIQEYVYKKVSELSGGKQRPTTRRENLEFDFRIW